ncbi:MAG: efflux RND transporter permease subunit, partial [Pseudomonadota bacterium]|nr:efflux RND transporter permease subunit [Pseudomonadota bacterium]
MFNRIIDWSVDNSILVVGLLLGIIAGSAMLLPSLNLDAFPDVTNVQVSVNTEAPGLAAEEIEQLITYPIEAVMYALPDVEEVRSISKTGLSAVTVVFKEGTDIYFARQLVFERLQTAKAFIPEDVGTPEMGPNTSGLGQIYQYSLISDDGAKYDAMALRSLNDWVVKLLLMPVDGVTDVLSFGGEVRQYQVNVEPSKLLAYGLSQQDLVTALQRNNTNVGGWYLERGQEQLGVRGTGWLASGEQGIHDIEQVPVKTVDGVVVTVSDLADVKTGPEIRQGAVTLSQRASDGKVEQFGEVVTGIVLKRMGANTKATIDGINSRVALINQALPEGVRFTPFYDQANLIEKAISTVVKALTIAFVFITIVLALFLMNVGATFLVLITIPIAIAMALAIMAFMGLSANLMSLGGIAVAIGMLVDGSVVMVENIFKRLNANTSSSHEDPQSFKSSVKLAGKEVARPIFFAASIILVVFAPLFSFEGVEAKLFQPMAISIMLAVLCATVVALFFVPALATFLFKRTRNVKPSAMLIPVERAYQRALSFTLLHTKWLVLLVGLLLVSAVALVPKIGT